MKGASAGDILAVLFPIQAERLPFSDAPLLGRVRRRARKALPSPLTKRQHKLRSARGGSPGESASPGDRRRNSAAQALRIAVVLRVNDVSQTIVIVKFAVLGIDTTCPAW
jgi:hypothetical protein